MNTIVENDECFLERIYALDESLYAHFRKYVQIDETLTRKLVSFQANKTRPSYRWYKYKEAFSSDLIKRLLDRCGVSEGTVFDPFAGAGTTLFTALERGLKAEGVELLPVGQLIIHNRYRIITEFQENHIQVLEKWIETAPWNESVKAVPLHYLRITKDAYSVETEEKIGKFLTVINSEEEIVRDVLFFALLCVLESVSFTRKDGQYLRWDYRSGRRPGQNTFDKGKVYEFDEAIVLKLKEIVLDVRGGERQPSLFPLPGNIQMPGKIILHRGSCLDILPKIQKDRFEAVVTSPPYCNRYDYTRTYALEHAMLGTKEDELVELRQTMLSCTVENKEKELLKINNEWSEAVSIADNLPLLQEIIKYLEYKKSKKELNNNGIPRMVKGYFYEMACVIQDCHRLLRENGVFVMVNDNVRYAGVSVSVDLILSFMAESLGFTVEKILVLPDGKGNSSQQMGAHGRVPLRKCIYVWRK